MNPVIIAIFKSIETIVLLQVSSFSTARRCLSSLRRWVETVFLIIPSFRRCLRTFLDSAIIADISPSVYFISITQLQIENVIFTHRVPGGAPCTRQGIASTLVLSIFLGAGSGACVHRVAPAPCFVNPAVLLAVTLRSRRPRGIPTPVLPPPSSEFLRCPSSRNSRSPNR